jgi:hypothetical protein
MRLLVFACKRGSNKFLKVPMLLIGLRRILVTSLFYLSAFTALAEAPREALISTHDSIIDLMESEVLDTVALDKAIHFTTPETKDIVLAPGSYQVMESDPDELKFLSLKGNKTAVVWALATHHQEHLAGPIALHVRDDGKFPHVILLLPDGRALEAVGSYDVMRSRGLLSLQLTPIQIHAALVKKLKKQ